MWLPEEEGELEGAYVTVELWHGVDAAVVEEEGVAAGVCVAGFVVNHGLVLVGHRHVLVCEGPAGNRDTGLGGGGGGVGVEVLREWEVCGRDGGAVRGTDLEVDIVDVVVAVVAGVAGGENVAESDEVTGAGV